MREREYDRYLPIQGNYYPITTSTFIESATASTRFTVLSHQAHGVSSLADGQLEIMLDRRLNQDDGRGLGEAITDNIRTMIPLWLVVETLPTSENGIFVHPSLSQTASNVWHSRNYPLHSMYASLQYKEISSIPTQWKAQHHLDVSPLSAPLPETLHLLTLAPRDKDSVDTILRIYSPPTHVAHPTEQQELDVENLFSNLFVINLKETSLSLLHDRPSTSKSKSMVKPTQISTFIVHLSSEDIADNSQLESLPTKELIVIDYRIHEQDIIEEEPNLQYSKDKDLVNDIKQTDFENDDDTKQTDFENQKENPSGLFSDKEKAKGPLYEADDEPISPEETELIVPIVKQDSNPQQLKDKDVEMKRNSGGGRVGKPGQVITKLKEKSSVNSASTTGLYAMSIVFYFGLLVIVVLGGWLLGRRRTHNKEDRATPASRSIPAGWKEREDSMMKLL